MKELLFSTHNRREIIDITDDVIAALETVTEDGAVCISVAHCTCSVYVNENESGLVQDTLALIDNLASGRWQHDRIDNNADAHLAATVLGNSVMLPLREGKPVLGTWQRIMFVELDGPRSRRAVQLTILI